MKYIVRLLLIIALLITTSLTAQAVEIESNSRYRMRGSLGSTVSDLSHGLRLDYNFDFGDYSFRVRTNLLKEYQYWYGRRSDESAILIINPSELNIIRNFFFDVNSEDLRVLNYNLEFETADLFTEYGHISTPGSTFSSGGSMLGLELNYDDFKLWYGDSGGSDNPLTADRFSLKRSTGKEEIFYSYKKRDENNTHHLAYNNRYQIADDPLDLKTGLEADLEADQFGLATRLNYASDINSLNYDLEVEYKSPTFEQLTSSGEGRAKLSFRTYHQLDDFLIDYKTSYRRNNLSGDLTTTNKNLNNRFNINYYGQQVYRINLIQRRNLRYQDDKLSRTTDDLELRANTKRGSIDYETGVKLKNTGYPKDDSKQEYQLHLGADYQQSPFKLAGNYQLNLESDDQLEHNVDLGFGYQRQLSQQIDYDLSYDLYLRDWQVISQQVVNGLSYSYDFNNSSFNANLNSTYYLHSQSFRNDLRFSYNYNF